MAYDIKGIRSRVLNRIHVAWDFKGIRSKVLNWIHAGLDTVQWCAILPAVIDFRVSRRR